MRVSWFALLIVIAMILFSIAVYPYLPEQVPSHWNIYGEVDGTMPKAVGAFMLPVLAAGLWALLHWLPRIDPKRERCAQFRGTLSVIIILTTGFFAFIHVLTLSAPLGWQIDTPRLIMAGASLLFVALGVLMPSISAQNYFIGIRTPWTLEDPEVWRQTHRLGGVLFIVGGLIGVVGSLLLPPAYGFTAVMAGVLLAAVGSIAGSWWIYRQLHAKD